MTHDIRRSRSDTSMSVKSSRPLSRASTTSIRSYDQHIQAHGNQPQFQQQPSQHQNSYPHPQYNASYASLESIIQAANHANQHDGMPIEAMQQLIGYSGDSAPHSGHPNGLASHSFDQNHTAHAIQIAMNQQQHYIPVPVEVEEKKKKGSASGAATNDKELREMLIRNGARELKDVAAEVIATDRTSKAEKSKQLFAMLWLKSVCKTAKTSVPRNRVYSKYAERCGTERVIPLNPASFGKLVRVIFPGIQTRRLGVRGESKYHYVDLALINDTEDGDDVRRPATANMTRQNSMAPTLDFNTTRVPVDTASFPPQDQAFGSNSGCNPQGTSKGILFTNIYDSAYRPITSQPTSNTYECELKFPKPEQLLAKDDLDMSLPDISPYLPARTDPDLASALVALYRTHCTSLIDSVRYCKEKQFFRLFTSFHGTLTLPVQRLFAQAEIAPWIKECDWLMYQKMIRNVSQLTLQVAPAPVLKFLDKVSKALHLHLSTVFNALPLHVMEAKLEPATLFAHLLRQMLRVNSTAHAAAAMLFPDENRNQMWKDWTTYVNLKRIIENELPRSCGHERVYNILTTEVRGLLTPLNFDGTVEDTSYASNETVIDRIAAFLTNLPSRFPHVPARTMLHCVNALGSAAIREITIENGTSMTGWWLTKVFIDEMGQWLASLGGFLGHSSPSWNAIAYSPEMMNDPLTAGMGNGSGSNNESRYSSIDADFGPAQSFMANDVHLQDAVNSNPEIHSRRNTQQYEPMSFNLDLELQTSQTEHNHDDSAIALLDDGLGSKYTSDMHQLQSHLVQNLAAVS